MATRLTKDYSPSETEKFMSARQKEYFRRKLMIWKEGILKEAVGTLESLQTESLKEPDIADRASSETDRSIELRSRDRQRKLVTKIETALGKLETGEYGYCEVSGEPINLKRLDARPIASMTLEAQEMHEKMEKVHRDD